MNTTATRNPLHQPLGIFLVALSLSIGWRSRMPYFALFGGLGLGFGGSIAYMYTVSFTTSGQLATTWYGYFTMFLVGGLWAGLGGAGASLAAASPRDRLEKMFVPLLFALGALTLHKFIEGPIEEFLQTPAAAGMDERWNRHKSPLYWLDADWFPAFMALLGVCAYDLWDRRFSKAHLLVAFAAAGALIGFALQWVFDLAGISSLLVRMLVVPLGDPTAINPETGEFFSPDNLLNNWPQFFGDFPQHIGWGLGLLAGGAVYFFLYGAWTRDSKLFLYLSLGWLIAFLVGPVFGTVLFHNYGGFRLTPPRSDDWAGILGVFIGMTVYCMRYGLAPVAYGGAVTGILGGIFFATAQFLRSLVIVPGHPYRTPGGTPESWAHYQSANWHSILEQSHGFGHGIALAIALGLLWSKLPVREAEEERVERPWTLIFSVFFVMFFMTYLNLFKNVAEWVSGGKPLVPEEMTAPLLKWITLDSATWFQLAWWAGALSFTALMIVHVYRKRLDVVPPTWLGKGQLIFILLLWIMVIGNFERALPGFQQGRLVTEWAIFINASIATFLVVFLPVSGTLPVAVSVPTSYRTLLGRTWIKGFIAAAILMSLYAWTIMGVYGEKTVFYPDYAHKRWGPEASWRIKPILKNKDHR
jgi:hypothetical protein